MTPQDVFDMARKVCGKWPSFMSNPNLQEFAKLVADKRVEGMVVMTPEEFKSVWDKAQAEKCQELAEKIYAMPFGDTAHSFAVWIKEQA